MASFMILLRAVSFGLFLGNVCCARVKDRNVQRAALRRSLVAIDSLGPDLKATPCAFAAKHKITVFGITKGSNVFKEVQDKLNQLARACQAQERNSLRLKIAKEQVKNHKFLLPVLESDQHEQLKLLQEAEDQGEPSEDECKAALAPSLRWKEYWQKFKHQLSKLWLAIKNKLGIQKAEYRNRIQVSAEEAYADKVSHLQKEREEEQEALEVLKAFGPFCNAKRAFERNLKALASYQGEMFERESNIIGLEDEVKKAKGEVLQAVEAHLEAIKEALTA